MRSARHLRSLAGGLVASLLASCGVTPVPEPRIAEAPELVEVGELEVRPEEREHPSLQLHFRYANRSSMLGYGSVQMWARPARDEIRVDAIVDAPAREARWTRCKAAMLRVDGRPIEVPAKYIGRPMDDGVYDAVLLRLGVHQLRAMARAGRVEAIVCGDPIALTAAQRRMLGRFVRAFDRLAEPEPHGEVPAFREVGPKIELLPTEQEDPGPYPA